MILVKVLFLIFIKFSDLKTCGFRIEDLFGIYLPLNELLFFFYNPGGIGNFPRFVLGIGIKFFAYILTSLDCLATCLEMSFLMPFKSLKIVFGILENGFISNKSRILIRIALPKF